MSSPSQNPFRLPPSVLAVGMTLIVIALCALFGISLLFGVWQNPSPVQTGIMPIQDLATITLDSSTALPETVVPAVLETVEPTLDFVLSFPPQATPFPTFDRSFVPTIAPLPDWVIYADDLEGYSIRYPQGWVRNEIPIELRQTAAAYVTTIGNYDGEDPALIDLKSNFPPQLFKMDLNISKTGASGLPIPQGQSLEEWVHTHSFVGGDVEGIEKGYVPVAGTQGYRILWQNSASKRGVTIWVPRGETMFTFEYFLSAEHPELAATAEQIIAGFQFTR